MLRMAAKNHPENYYSSCSLVKLIDIYLCKGKSTCTKWYLQYSNKTAMPCRQSLLMDRCFPDDSQRKSYTREYGRD